MENTVEITEMLKAWGNGKHDASDEFMPLIYDELKRQARRYLNRERANHTLQTTALVNEAYIRLVEQRGVSWQNRAHFFGIAAQMMRRILVNYAVGRQCEKRGGSAETMQLDDTMQVGATERSVDLIALDEALTRLEKLDERQARVIELRYFAGMSIEDTAEIMSISPATVKREWNMAKTWLRCELAAPPSDGT